MAEDAMPITQLQKDVTRSLRQYAKHVNAKVRFGSSTGLSRYITMWVVGMNRTTPDNKREYYYPDTFKLEDRVRALKIIYGENCEFASSGAAGNIMPHMMTMHPSEWVKFFEDTEIPVHCPNFEAGVTHCDCGYCIDHKALEATV